MVYSYAILVVLNQDPYRKAARALVMADEIEWWMTPKCHRLHAQQFNNSVLQLHDSFQIRDIVWQAVHEPRRIPWYSSGWLAIICLLVSASPWSKSKHRPNLANQEPMTHAWPWFFDLGRCGLFGRLNAILWIFGRLSIDQLQMMTLPIDTV